MVGGPFEPRKFFFRLHVEELTKPLPADYFSLRCCWVEVSASEPLAAEGQIRFVFGRMRYLLGGHGRLRGQWCNGRTG